MQILFHLFQATSLLFIFYIIFVAIYAVDKTTKKISKDGSDAMQRRSLVKCMRIVISTVNAIKEHLKSNPITIDFARNVSTIEAVSNLEATAKHGNGSSRHEGDSREEEERVSCLHLVETADQYSLVGELRKF